MPRTVQGTEKTAMSKTDPCRHRTHVDARGGGAFLFRACVYVGNMFDTLQAIHIPNKSVTAGPGVLPGGGGIGPPHLKPRGSSTLQSSCMLCRGPRIASCGAQVTRLMHAKWSVLVVMCFKKKKTYITNTNNYIVWDELC